MVGLNADAEEQREEAERLRSALRSNTSLLESSIQQFRQERQMQDATIAQHQLLIRRLQNRRVKQDGVVDAVLALASLWCVNTTLFEAPVRLALSIIPRRKARVWLRQFSKLSAFLYVATYLRGKAIDFGVHSNVGSFVPYVRHAQQPAPMILSCPVCGRGGDHDAVLIGLE